MNIILTGFMGTGKSTVGQAVAERLHYRLVDTDDLIEAQHGPITGVFAVKGEDGFRAIEQDAAQAAASQKQVVISTGGGMMLHPDSAWALERSGLVYTLTASVDDILERIGADGIESRPMFDDVDDPRAKIEELLAERAETYDTYVQIDTSGREPADIADEIVADIEARRAEFASANRRTVFGLPLTTGLVAGLLTAAVFLAAGLFLINQTAPERFNGVELSDPIDIPDGAPEADEYVELDPKLTTGDAVDRAVALRVREVNTVPGSATHIGTNRSRLGTREVYTWMASTGPADIPCVGVLSTSGTNSAQCFSPEEEPTVEAGVTTFDDGNLWGATLRSGDEDFRWLTVITSDGEVVLTDVVNGVGHLEWIGAAPVAYSAFNENAESIWNTAAG